MILVNWAQKGIAVNSQLGSIVNWDLTDLAGYCELGNKFSSLGMCRYGCK